MALRPAQLALRLDAASPADSQSWRDGATTAFLGTTLTLRLDTSVEDAARLGDELHLPLPPQASPRQIQDRAEAWLRSEAESFFTSIITRKLAGRPLPTLQLSFATRSGWTEVEAARNGSKTGRGRLRVNWRLIEQAPDVIEQVLQRAIGELNALHASALAPDLFGAFAA